MSRLRDMKIRSKLLGSFMLVIALIVALVTLASAQIDKVRDRYATVIRHPLSIEMTLQEFHAGFQNLRRIATALAFSTGQDMPHEQLFSEASAADARANAHLDKVKTLVLGITPEDLQGFAGGGGCDCGDADCSCDDKGANGGCSCGC